MVIRHTVLFAWAEGVTPEQRLTVKEGLGYVGYFSDVLALDFGENLEGGLSTRYGLALMHDHASRAKWDAYNEDAHHHRVGNHIKTVTNIDLVTRVDWEYNGPPSQRGMIRHTALYRWTDTADAAQKAAVYEGLASLRTECDTVRALEYGDDLGWYASNHDWIFEAHFDDFEGLKAYLEHPARLEVADVISAAVDESVTAQVQHRMMSG